MIYRANVLRMNTSKEYIVCKYAKTDPSITGVISERVLGFQSCWGIKVFLG